MNGVASELSRVLRPGGRVFFGWWMVLAASGVQFLAGMLWVQSYGAYVVLLEEDFGWSKTLLSGAFALTRIESGLLGPLQGWMVDRFGPRRILSIGTILFGSGFILFGRIDSLFEFYAFFAMIALGASLGGFPTLMVAIVNWFSHHRSKAVAFSQIGFALGGLSVPAVVFSLQLIGWRETAFWSGVLIMMLGLPLAQVIRHRPDDHGEVQDGIVQAPRTGSAARRAEPDFSAAEALRTHSFWLISAGHACSLLVVSAMLVHLIPYLTEDLGYSLPEAGSVVALMTGFQIVGQLSGGVLGDRLDKRLICVVCMLGHALGLLLLTFATSLFMVIGFAALHGLAWGVRGPLMVALRADYFGPTAFGTISGLSSLIVMLGMSSGPLIAGYMADVSGNYRLGLSVLVIGVSIGLFSFLLATPPKPRPLLTKAPGVG